MKIISPDHPIVCLNCNTLLGISDSDLTPAPTFGVYSFTCPVCSVEQFVYSSNLPQDMRNKLKKYNHHWG